MDVIDQLTDDINRIADGNGDGFQTFDMGVGVQQDARITRADLEELKLHVLAAIDDIKTHVTRKHPWEDAEKGAESSARTRIGQGGSTSSSTKAKLRGFDLVMERRKRKLVLK